AAPTSLAGQKDSMHQGTPLDPRFTFDRYVTGKSNEFAFAAAKRISETDDTQYNPFILYGGVGLGKTHLMQAIAWEKKRLNPNINIVYVSAEKFVNMFVSALRNKKNMEPFEKMFRDADLLMVDDIQFIAGKEQSQEKFFHTFNSLMDSRKQIVFTADKPPAELDGIEDRLRSRFAWGLTTAIHKPSLETRIAILEEKAQSLSVDLKRDVAHFLAEKIDSNVRELEGALNRLIAHTQLVQKDITIETTQEILHDIFKSYEKTVTIDDIQRKVTDHFNIKMSELLGTRRSRAVARPRQIAMFLAKNCTTKSYPDIGRAFGGRDHTTVMHAVKTVEKLIDTDPA
ncbi:MAG: chromosomal replication initiator protein DnaA, partial [Pseudomonadota bacterium]|nr:chromosomal replication initiator protein DnaA [Pseudomonadota bacterium]